MPSVVSFLFSKAVMSFQSRVGTVSIGVIPSSVDAGAEAEAEDVQEPEASGVFLYILEPIKSPENHEHDEISLFIHVLSTLYPGKGQSGSKACSGNTDDEMGIHANAIRAICKFWKVGRNSRKSTQKLEEQLGNPGASRRDTMQQTEPQQINKLENGGGGVKLTLILLLFNV